MASDFVNLTFVPVGGDPVSPGIADGFGSTVGTGTLAPRADPATRIVSNSLTEYIVPMTTVSKTAAAGFAGSWVQARAGRKVRARSDDIEIEAGSNDELAAALATIRAYRGGGGVQG